MINEKIDVTLLAEFVEEGLGTTGILDDADVILADVFENGGIEEARNAFNRYNNAIQFVNDVLGSNLKAITEKQFQRYIG